MDIVICVVEENVFLLGRMKLVEGLDSGGSTRGKTPACDRPVGLGLILCLNVCSHNDTLKCLR